MNSGKNKLYCKKEKKIFLSKPIMPHKKEPIKQQRIGESGYVLPDHIPPGEIVKGLRSDDDGVKNASWRIGKSIGKQLNKFCILALRQYCLRIRK